MTNINHVVWKLIQSDIAIQKDIWRKLLNTRALAKHFIKTYSLSASLDAVISAIRRFQTQESFQEEERALLHVFKDSVVSTKNNMACITAHSSLGDFFKRVYTTNATTHFRITTGNDELKLMLENPLVQQVLPLFHDNELENIERDLSEILVTVSETSLHTKGVLARIASELALANINIHEIIIVPPHFLIYVKQKDIVKAHESVLTLCRGD